jgi:ribosomal protein S18 acetylase RimI-like enzyme
MMNEIYVQLKGSSSMQQITIRPLVKSDLLALEWEGEFIHFRNVFADVYKKVEKDTAKAWVAVNREGYMIGQVFLQMTSERLELANGWDRAYLYSLRVRPQYQNLGIGSQLINVVETTLLKMDFNRVTLNVSQENARAINLYARLGFMVVAEEPGVWSYPDHKGVWRTVTDPSWRMEKILTEKTSETPEITI